MNLYSLTVLVISEKWLEVFPAIQPSHLSKLRVDIAFERISLSVSPYSTFHLGLIFLRWSTISPVTSMNDWEIYRLAPSRSKYPSTMKMPAFFTAALILSISGEILDVELSIYWCISSAFSITLFVQMDLLQASVYWHVSNKRESTYHG